MSFTIAASSQESWFACGASITISQPGGQLSSEKRACCSVIFTFWVYIHQDSNSGEAAVPLNLDLNLNLS